MIGMFRVRRFYRVIGMLRVRRFYRVIGMLRVRRFYRVIGMLRVRWFAREIRCRLPVLSLLRKHKRFPPFIKFNKRRKSS